MDPTTKLTRSYDIAAKVALILSKRAKIAQERLAERLQKAHADNVADMTMMPATPWGPWSAWYDYASDFAQRSVLFWDTIRERGNNFIEHTHEGLPPVLH